MTTELNDLPVLLRNVVREGSAALIMARILKSVSVNSGRPLQLHPEADGIVEYIT